MGYADIAAYFSRWIDTTASAIVSLLSSVRVGKTVQVIEEDDGLLRDPVGSRCAIRAAIRARADHRWKARRRAPRQHHRDAQWQPGGTEAAARPRAVPPARVAAARDRVSRRRGSPADRSPDTVDRERRGLRLECANRERAAIASRSPLRQPRVRWCSRSSTHWSRLARRRSRSSPRHPMPRRSPCSSIAGRARSMSRVCAAPWSPF